MSLNDTHQPRIVCALSRQDFYVENFAGQAAHGRAIDLWAVGVTLYSFVFGHTPWISDNILEMFHKIRDEPYVQYQQWTSLVTSCDSLKFDHPVDPQLQDLLTKILQKDPTKRITMDEVKVSNTILAL